MVLPKELTTVTPLSKGLALIVFILLPFIGFFAGMNYQSMVDGANQYQSTNKVAKSISPTKAQLIVPSSSIDVNQNANWKTFNAASGISFKYPSNWIVKENITPVDASGWGPIEGLTITSPNGLLVRFSDHITGLGGGCGDPKFCAVTHTLKYQPVSVPNYGKLYLVEEVVKDPEDKEVLSADVGLIDDQSVRVGASKHGYYMVFNDKDTSKRNDQFTFSVDTKSKKDINQYFNSPDIITAEQILTSLSF